MAEKDAPPVIDLLEEEEEEWPEAGAQNIEEAEQYVDCINNVFDHLSTHILAAAVWLKMLQKYFNEGTAKEASERFDVRAKQLSRVLTGRKYLGGTQVRKHKATKEPLVRRKKTDG